MRRVVITGAGTINPLGSSVADTWDAFRAGRVAIGALDIPDIDRLHIRIGAQIKDFDPNTYFTRAEQALYDRATQFALLAAREAMAQSAPDLSEAELQRAGVIMGTAAGGQETLDANYRAVFEERKNRVHPFTVPRLMANAAASQLSITHNFGGPVYTVSTACASSNHAIGQAFHLIRAGSADVMMAGGADATLSFGGIKAWEGLRVMSPDGCRPFCATRNGMVQGEGAAVFVLEEHDRALTRGAPILAEVAGFAMCGDARDIVAPCAAGATRAMDLALKDAGLVPGHIDYINAHGTGTKANDHVESEAISKLFGTGPDAPLVSSTKSLHGHLMGASGAVELLSVIQALSEGVIAPTAGHVQDDPNCPVNLVTGSARQAKVGAAMSNAFAFGGLNAILALRPA